MTIVFSKFEMATQGEADWILNWWKDQVTSAPPETLPAPGKVHCPERYDRESRTAILLSVSEDAAQPRCELWLMTQKQLDTWCPKEGSVQRSHQQLACCTMEAIAPFKFKMEWCLGYAANREFKIKKNSCVNLISTEGRALSEAHSQGVQSAIDAHFKDPHEKRLAADPTDAIAWMQLGTYGGGNVKGETWSNVEFYQNAVEADPKYAKAWYNLGCEGGGTVRGRKWSAAECFQNAH